MSPQNGDGVSRSAMLTGSQETQTVIEVANAQTMEMMGRGSGVRLLADNALPTGDSNRSNKRTSELGVGADDGEWCQIGEAPRSEQTLTQELDTFITQMRLEKPRVLGFPGNRDFRYGHLAGLLDLFINNSGDPAGSEQSNVNSKPFERAAVRFLAELSNAEPARTYGYLTSGGSEANLFGLDRGCALLPDAPIYASAAAHYSIRKCARLLGKELVTVKCDEDGRLDPHALARVCRDDAGRGAVVVATIGTTMAGAIDDVAAVSESAVAAGDVYVHLDAALTGLLIPFTAEGPSWGFASPAVGSLAISMHKALGMPVPCAVALCRSHLIDRVLQAEYLGTTDSTIGCSRSGLASVLTWYALASKGRAGLAENARRTLANAEFAAKKLADIGANPMLLPFSITVVFDRPAEWVCRKYHLATEGERAHIVTVGHVTREVIDELCLDIQACR
jgi:histidine decarboxylase